VSDLGNPELPEPEKAPAGEDAPQAPPMQEQPDPTMNGNGGGSPYAAQPQPSVDMGKLVEWMKHTDKQIVILTMGQLGLAAAVMFLLWKSKGNIVKAVPKP
jgi:hypothetical protein